MRATTKTFLLFGLLIIACPPASGLFEVFKDLQNQLVNFANVLKNSTAKFWNTLTSKELVQLGPDNLKQLLSNTEGRVLPRVKDEIVRLLLVNMTSRQICDELRNILPSDVNIGKLQQLTRAMPRPEMMTKENVTFCGDKILLLGNSKLLQIQDREALMELKRIAMNAAGDMNFKKQTDALIDQINIKLYGPPEQWTTDSLQQMEIRKLSVDSIRRMRPEVLLSRKADFINAVSNSLDIDLQRAVLKKCLEGENFYSETDPQRALNIINNLGGLKSYILIEDITNNAVRSNEQIMNICKENAKRLADRGMLSPKSARVIMDDFARIQNITEADLNGMGKYILGLANPRALQMAVKNRVIAENNVRDIVDSMPEGPGRESKMQVLASVVTSYLNSSRTGGSVMSYPNEIIANLPLRLTDTITERDAKEILSREPLAKLPEHLIGSLLMRVNSGFETLNERAASLIPLAKLKQMSPSALLNSVIGLPPMAAVAMKAAEKAFAGKTRIDAGEIDRSRAAVPFMGVAESMLINGSDIATVLQKMKDINPSLAACGWLKKLYYNYSVDNMGSTSEEDAVRRMTVGDVQDSPVCVIAAFGGNNLQSLGTDQKIALLYRLGKISNPGLCIARGTIMKIIRDGLQAMRAKAGLQPGDLESIGNAVAYIPADILRAADDAAVPSFVRELNDFINKTQIKPCFDSGQRAAIGELVKKFKGYDVSKWDTVGDISCLLCYLPRDDWDGIADEVISATSCVLGNSIPAAVEQQEALCNSSIGESEVRKMRYDEDELKRQQQEAAMNIIELAESSKTQYRRKRETAQERELSAMCSKLTYTGVNGFTTNELESLNFTDITYCLQDFGYKDMDQSKAEILLRKLREGVQYSDISYFNASFLLKMGYILKAIPVTDIASLQDFTYGTEFDDLVEFLGSVNVFTMAQISEFAKKVKLEWRSPSAMVADDITIVNKLLCGLSSADIGAISVDAFRASVSTVISKLTDCPLNPALNSFARLAVSAYGNIETWNKSDLAEMGVIVAGLSPEDIRRVDPVSMEGLTPTAIKKLSLDAIKALEADHFLFLNPATAQSVTPEQMSVLDPAMRRALQVSLAGFFYSDKGGKSGTAVNWMMVIPLTYCSISIYHFVYK